MKYTIITGASRGLGEAIALRLLREQMAVVSVSRTENEQLKKFALEKGLNYTYYHCNLSLEIQVQEVFLEIAHNILNKNPEEIYLFNNAGVIEPIETVGKLDQTPILRNIQVNLIAPILITNIFLNKAGQTNSKVFITNITSGAATRPIEGWSVYCTSKAGLNMFTETVAIEQATQNTQNKIIAFSPGVMDTDMQTTIRSSSKDAFKELDKFIEFKEDNKLLSADVVGNALVDFILKDDMASGKVYHISDLLN